jgi:hypothetical protein
MQTIARLAPLVAAFAAIFGSAGASAQAQGQAPPPPPCSAAEHRQLDFWVGEWEAETQAPDGSTVTATNSITRDFGACVIREHFRLPRGNPDGSEFVGGSYSIYDRPTSSWRQMWVDNAGGMFDLRGGPVSGQGHVFELVNIEPRGPERGERRMIWEDVHPDRFVWRWQRHEADGSWSDLWVLRYRRRGEAEESRGG